MLPEGVIDPLKTLWIPLYGSFLSFLIPSTMNSSSETDRLPDSHIIWIISSAEGLFGASPERKSIAPPLKGLVSIFPSAANPEVTSTGLVPKYFLALLNPL